MKKSKIENGKETTLFGLFHTLFFAPPFSLWGRILFGSLPFLLVVLCYGYGSWQRHVENPKDKIMPNLRQLAVGVERVVEENPRTGTRWIVEDTKISLVRLLLGISIASTIAVFLGLFMGTFHPIHALFAPFITAVSKIPPLALLPLIFIALGTEEEAKITLIVLGIFPTLTQDVYLRVREIPVELIQKAFTLGASPIEVTFKVILAGIWPKVLDSIRLAIGPAWIFLIAAEAISSEAGLGYRIYVVQRQLGVNMILPYIAWISLLGYGMDYAIRFWIRWRHPWIGHR